MINVPENILEEFLNACRMAGKHGLVRCSSGNLSFRLDDTRLLTTSSRSWLENITAEQVSICRISDGALLEGPRQTVEISLHAEILKLRPDVNAVIHFQTPYATALGCRETDDINYFVIPEIPFYIGPVAKIPFLLPGSKELAEAVAVAIKDHDMVMLSNHGQVTVAADFYHLIQKAEFFELACEIITHAGDKLKPLSEEYVKRIIALR